jgi:hypothetical protein
VWDWIKKILLPRGGVGGIKIFLSNLFKSKKDKEK